MSAINTVDSNMAFVGVSLDSKCFTREWVCFALKYILKRHDRLLLLLADELSSYTRTTKISNTTVCLDYQASAKYTTKRADELYRFFNSEIQRLDPSYVSRIAVKRWRDYSDAPYAELVRKVRIAYDVIPQFKSCVHGIAEDHVKRLPPTVSIQNSIEICASYILDEMGMCIRVTEIGGWSNEYHPSSDIETLTELYAKIYEQFGLTVEKLTGSPQRRIFHLLSKPEGVNSEC